MVLELTKDNFEAEVKNNKGVVIVDFWAPWCGPCKNMGPVFEELSGDVKDVKFAKVNTDDNPDLAQGQGVMSLPTFVIYKDGKEVDRIIGMTEKEGLHERIKPHK